MTARARMAESDGKAPLAPEPVRAPLLVGSAGCRSPDHAPERGHGPSDSRNPARPAARTQCMGPAGAPRTGVE